MYHTFWEETRWPVSSRTITAQLRADYNANIDAVVQDGSITILLEDTMQQVRDQFYLSTTHDGLYGDSSVLGESVPIVGGDAAFSDNATSAPTFGQLPNPDDDALPSASSNLTAQ